MEKSTRMVGFSLLLAGNVILLFADVSMIGRWAILIGCGVVMSGLLFLLARSKYYIFAFLMTFATLAISYISIHNWTLGRIIVWLYKILSCFIAYFICTGTSKCIPEHALASDSARAWYILGQVVAAIVGLLSAVPFLRYLIFPLRAASGIISLIAAFQYLRLLWECRNEKNDKPTSIDDYMKML